MEDVRLLLALFVILRVVELLDRHR